MRTLLRSRGAIPYKKLPADARETAAKIFMSNPVVAKPVPVIPAAKETKPEVREEIKKTVETPPVMHNEEEQKVDYFDSFEEVDEIPEVSANEQVNEKPAEKEIDSIISKVPRISCDLVRKYEDLFSKSPRKLSDCIKEYQFERNFSDGKIYSILHRIFQHDLESYTDYMTRFQDDDYYNRLQIETLLFYERNEFISNFFNLIKDDIRLLNKIKKALDSVAHGYYESSRNALKQRVDEMLDEIVSNQKKELDSTPMNHHEIVSKLNNDNISDDSINKSETFTSRVIDYIMAQAEPEEKKSIIQFLARRKNIDYNQKDKNDISILEKVINAEDKELLNLISQTTLNYYPELDYAYSNIQDKAFKKLVDNINLRFQDVEEAIRLSSRAAMDKLLAQLQSPFFKDNVKTRIRNLVDNNATSDMKAYLASKYKELL